MGDVYLCRTGGNRLLAVKTIRPEYADNAVFRARFRREVAAAQAVSGAFTAAVHSHGIQGTTLWLATEFIQAPSLRELVTRVGPLRSDALALLASGLAEALESIHAVGLVHRDLKPSNILCPNDGPRVIDFGIAQSPDDLTTVGTGIFGTPGYIAPEQAMGRESTNATDVFALGASVAYAYLGRGPFGDGPRDVVLHRTLHERPDLTGIPRSYRSFISECLRRDPTRRPTLTELIAEIGAIRERHLSAWSRAVDGYHMRSRVDGESSHQDIAPWRPPIKRRVFIIGASELALYVLLLTSSSPTRPRPPEPSGEGRPSGGTRKSGSHNLVRTINVEFRPQGIAVGPDGSKVFVAAEGGHLYILRVPTGAVDSDAEVDLKYDGGIAVTGTGQSVYFVDSANVLRRYDLLSSAVGSAGIQLGGYSQGMAIAPDGRTLYIATYSANRVAVVDTVAGNSVSRSYQTSNPGAVAASGDGRTICVANFQSRSASLINADSLRVIGEPTVVGQFPNAVVFSRDSSRAYVASRGSGTLSEIDVATASLVKNLEVGPSPMAVAVHPLADVVYSSNFGKGQRGNLVVISGLRAGTPNIREVAVGVAPSGIAVEPQGRLIYVTNFESRSVSIIERTV